MNTSAMPAFDDAMSQILGIPKPQAVRKVLTDEASKQEYITAHAPAIATRLGRDSKALNTAIWSLTCPEWRAALVAGDDVEFARLTRRLIQADFRAQAELIAEQQWEDLQ